MFSTAKRHFGVLAMLSVVALMGATGTGGEPACATARKWAQRNHANLPTTLVAFSTHSMMYRKAIYRELPVEERRSLWREHLESFLGPKSALTGRQQATVRFVLSRLDRYVDTPARARAAIEKDGLTTARLRAEFGDQLGHAVFATLGDDQPLPPYCNCSQQSNWCGSGRSCGTRTTDCIAADEDCGFLWCYACDGVCEA